MNPLDSLNDRHLSREDRFNSVAERKTPVTNFIHNRRIAHRDHDYIADILQRDRLVLHCVFARHQSRDIVLTDRVMNISNGRKPIAINLLLKLGGELLARVGLNSQSLQSLGEFLKHRANAIGAKPDDLA